MSTRTAKRPEKRCFSATERAFNAAQRGIEPFAAQWPVTEERLVARALASKTTRGVFYDAAWRQLRSGGRDRRLLEKFMSFPRSVRALDVTALELFYDEALARKEMLELATDATGVAFRPFASALGRLGGPGVRALLNTRVRGFVNAVSESRGRTLPLALAEAYVQTAYALLRLDPDANRGADALLAAFEQRARFGEYANVVPFMREAVTSHPQSRTRALVRVREALRGLLDADASEDDLGMALSALRHIDFAKTVQRARETLFSSLESVRWSSAQELSMYALDSSRRPLLRYIAQYPSDYDAFRVARRLGSRLSVGLVQSAERALAHPDPATRLRVAESLLPTPGVRAASIASRALRTEPDLLIAHLLRRRASRDRKAPR